MMNSDDTGSDMRIVQRGMERFINERDSLPATSDIIELVELTRFRAEQALEYLEKNGAVRRAYHKQKVASIWLPTHMWEGLLNSRHRPGWMDDFGLAQREKMEKAIREKEQERNRLRRIEELLYTSGRSLEQAIYTALSLLEVEELSADFDDPDSWDFSFQLNGVLYIAEAKGKEGPGDKDDVQQLGGWVDKYVEENPDVDTDRLCGLLVVNHYRDRSPANRWPEDGDNPPVTDHGETFLGVGSCRRFVTTIDLFEIAATVVNEEATPAEARSELESRMRRKVTDDG